MSVTWTTQSNHLIVNGSYKIEFFPVEAEAPAVADPTEENREDIEGEDADIDELKDPIDEPNLSCNFC